MSLLDSASPSTYCENLRRQSPGSGYCRIRLFKGSVTPDTETAPHYAKAEKPVTFGQLKNPYSPNYVVNGCRDSSKNDFSTSSSGGSTAATDKLVVTTSNGTDEGIMSSASIQSLFDEQEEWAKISEIMASFGTNNGRKSIVAELEQELESRLGFPLVENNSSTLLDEPSKISFTSVGQWLHSLGLAEFENAFINFGYDDIDFVNGVINDCDLKEIGVVKEIDRQTILKESTTLPNVVGNYWTTLAPLRDTNEVDDLVKEWLNSINLGAYAETFRRNLYNDLDRIKRIWEVELTAFLEITKPGHRRRILASVNEAKLQSLPPSNHDSSASNNLDDLHADLDQLKNNIQELEEEIRSKNSATSLNSKCKTLPPRVSFHSPPVATRCNTAEPSQPAVRPRRKTRRAPPPPCPAHNLEIRNPSELLVGVPVAPEAQWLHKPVSLVIGTVDYTASYLGSTVVKELLGTESTKKSIQKLRKSTSVVDCRITPEIILAISYRGVKFLNVPDHSPICEHEIQNIHCACQDTEDLTHFAYITKDRASKTHYCHVFCVQTMDQATEVILSLGQAFEVAYQMALKESSASCNGIARSHSTVSTNSSLKNSHRPLVDLEDVSVTPTTSANISDWPVVDHEVVSVTPTTSSNVSHYFVAQKDGRIPLLGLLAETKFQEVKKLLDVEGSSDVRMFRRLILSVGNGEFRNSHRVDKKVADEIFAQAINELNYRSENTTQLDKYYRSSYPTEGSPSKAAIEAKEVEVNGPSTSLSRYFTRDANSRIPLWVMMVEEQYEDIRGVLLAPPSLSQVQTLRLIAGNMADKGFRETHGISKEVADEVFECAADELMAREGTMSQLLDHYNKSYN